MFPTRCSEVFNQSHKILRLSLTLLCLTLLVLVAQGKEKFRPVLGTKFFAPAAMERPEKGVPFTDPTFHTQIVRITDKSDGYSGPGIENEYARTDPENADGSFLILRGNDGEWYRYRTSDFKLVEHLDITGGGEEPEPRWDADNPKLIYYLYGSKLKSYNFETGKVATVHDFREDFSSATYITTKTEGDSSLDRRYWCFMLEDYGYRVQAVVCYDKKLNKIIGRRDTFPDNINWVSMDMSGQHCIVGYENLPAQVFTTDLNVSVSLPNGANGHMDPALTADGRDVMVFQNNDDDWITMVDLSTGVETKLLPIPFDVNGDIGLHFSGNCSGTPGWVLVSTYGSKNLPTESKAHSWMDTQLFLLELKDKPRVFRLAHTHAYTSLDFSGEKNYFSEAFATINQKGNHICFGSNWEDFTTDYSDAYRLTLPEDWNKTLKKNIFGK